MRICSLSMETVQFNRVQVIRSGILITHLYLRQLLWHESIYIFKMKTKKQSVHTSSILAELILQTRTSPLEQASKTLQLLKGKLSYVHRNHHYTKQLLVGIVEKPQYNIESRLMARENRLNSKQCLLAVHFKLTEKRSSDVAYVESWLLSVGRNTKDIKQVDVHQQFAYLLQEIVRALKCQFLNDFSNMGQQFKSRYILDYEIETNLGRKAMRKLSLMNYQKLWVKQAMLDEQNKLTVSCYHNTNKRLLTAIAQERQQSRQAKHLIVKHGSQETKPSNSGQYQLSTSIQQKTTQQVNVRKTSMFEFYDQELNITVLSNDSDSFKKSTGRIEGVYTGEDLKNQLKQEEGYDSDDDEFQLLIQQDALQEVANTNPKQQQQRRVMNIERQLEGMFYQLDQTIGGYFI